MSSLQTTQNINNKNIQETLNFIEEYRSFSVLWDVTDKNYINKQLRKDAIENLAQNYNLTADGVIKKIKSLRSYFSKEHQKSIKKKSGSAADFVYVSGWFAYKSLLFIKDAITPNETRESGFNDSNTPNFDEVGKHKSLQL